MVGFGFRVWSFGFKAFNSKPETPNSKLALHRGQEFGVGLGFLQPLKHDFHLLDGRERIQDAAHHPDAIEVFLAEKQFFLARAGALQVNGREETLV